MSRHVNDIGQRLSLRTPQQRSLEILDRVMEVAHPRRTADAAAALAAIRAEYPAVGDFERSFPSLCFALATGVGKTRLMGAFITYLFLETELGIAPPVPAPAPRRGSAASASPLPPPRFETPVDQAVARLTVEAIQHAVRDPAVRAPAALESDVHQARLVAQVTDRMRRGQQGLFPEVDETKLKLVVNEVTTTYLRRTISVPRVLVVPTGEVRAGFEAFQLDLSGLDYKPVSDKFVVHELRTGKHDEIAGSGVLASEHRLEDYVVRALIDFDDVSYDDHAELLYDLAGQVVRHLRSSLKDEDQVRNVLAFYQQRIGALVHAQMERHAWQKASALHVEVSPGFIDARPQPFAAPAGEEVRHFEIPVEQKSRIRTMLFGGFSRCLYPIQKFDSDSERLLACVLERHAEKWLKPGKGTFHIHYEEDRAYEPDFIAETATDKLILEPKRRDDLQDPVVVAKARAASTWCRHATAYELEHGDRKPWRYLLIPHDDIGDNSTLQGLIDHHEHRAAPEDG